MLKDLESTDAAGFGVEATQWTVSEVITSSIYTDCGGTQLLGGAGVLQTDATYQRTYKNLPPHDMIYYSLRIMLIDTWYFNASVVVLFDPKHYIIPALLFETADFTSNSCGNSGLNDLPLLKAYGKTTHTDSSLTLRVTSNTFYDPATRSYGFRDINLVFRNSTDQDTDGYCKIAGTTVRLRSCACPEGQYNDPSAGCKPCNTLCKTCLGPSASQCMECGPGAFYDGLSCSACSTGCSSCTGSAADQCTTCDSGYFFFSNKACISQCDPPLTSIVSPAKYCNSICASSNKFLYSNGTCGNACDFTYNQVNLFGSKLCYDRCPIPQYYDSSTSTCVTSCPPGILTNPVSRFCYTCQDTLCDNCYITSTSAQCISCVTGSILDSDNFCKGKIST